MDLKSCSIPRIMIAGGSSGAGKTTMMMALTQALRQAGLKVVCFKCGPDYLDPTYHRLLSGYCQNLDGWLMGRDASMETFATAAEGADIALIEGVMGVFDGAGPRSKAGGRIQRRNCQVA